MAITLSAEAVISLVALMVSLPPAMFAVWRWMCHQRATKHIACLTFRLSRRENPDGKRHFKICVFIYSYKIDTKTIGEFPRRISSRPEFTIYVPTTSTTTQAKTRYMPQRAGQDYQPHTP